MARTASDETPPDGSRAQRLLDFAASEDPARARETLRALSLLMIVHLILEMGLWVGQSDRILQPMSFVIAGLGIALAIGFDPARRRLSLWLVAGATLAIHVILFPNAANHMALIAIALWLMAFFDSQKDAEAVAALASLRWLTAIVLFSTGLQKVLYGTYFHGEYLSWQLAHADRFGAFFELIVSSDEIERLRSLASGATDMGVYRTQDPLLWVASNAAWLGELVLPALLLYRRTRDWAVLATVLLLLSIEAGAREIFFGVVFVNLILSFASQNWIKRLFPLSIALYLVSVASRIGWLPDWSLN